MNGFWFVYTTYKDGRVRVRDRPYKNEAAAKRAAARIKEKKNAESLHSVNVAYQTGITAAEEFDVRNI